MSMTDKQLETILRNGIVDWVEVERPVGPQPLPAWVKGAWVDWSNGYSNSPSIRIKMDGEAARWDCRYERIGNAYVAKHPDGRLQIHHHTGAVNLCGAWRTMRDGKQITQQWQIVDVPAGETPEQAAQRAGEAHLKQCAAYLKPEELAATTLDVKAVKATSAQKGYAGRHFTITLVDGSELVLRGPWHGGPPPGYVEAITVDMSDEWNSEARNAGRHYRPWYRRQGGFGWFITEDLLLRIVARYCPHVPLALVEHSYGIALEPFLYEWEMPKGGVYGLEQYRACRNEPAGPGWRVFWEGRCGNNRNALPTYGFREGVTP